jgi:hypothetical protein
VVTREGWGGEMKDLQGLGKVLGKRNRDEGGRKVDRHDQHMLQEWRRITGCPLTCTIKVLIIMIKSPKQ